MKILISYICSCGVENKSIFDTTTLGRGCHSEKIDPEMITHGVCSYCGRLPLGISVVEPDANEEIGIIGAGCERILNSLPEEPIEIHEQETCIICGVPSKPEVLCLTCLYKIGTKVRLTKDIWDDGEDHHPPCYLAHKGDVLIVRRAAVVGGTSVGISHENRTDNYFNVTPDEIERAE